MIIPRVFTRSLLVAAGAWLLMSTLAPKVRADLIGDNVTMSVPGIGSDSGVVAAGTGDILSVSTGSIEGGLNLFQADFEASGVTFRSVATSLLPMGHTFGAGSTLVFSDLNFGLPDDSLLGVTLVSSDLSAITQSSVSFDAHSVSIDLSGTTWLNNQIELSFRNQPEAVVPEPATLSLLGLGLAGLALLRRRRLA